MSCANGRFYRKPGPDRPIRTVESGRRLKEFHVIAFSISFENDFPNVLTVLHHAGIPLPAAGRGSPHPLVMAGGVALLFEPRTHRPVYRLFPDRRGRGDPFRLFSSPSIRTGKGQIPCGKWPGMFRAFTCRRSTGWTIMPTARSGIFHRRSMSRRPFPADNAADISKTATCSTILTPHTPFKRTYLIEVARGCPHGCRFCSSGFNLPPAKVQTLSAP